MSCWANSFKGAHLSGPRPTMVNVSVFVAAAVACLFGAALICFSLTDIAEPPCFGIIIDAGTPKPPPSALHGMSMAGADAYRYM